MKPLLLSFLLLCACGTDTRLEGCPDCYPCGGGYCLDVSIDGHPVQAIWDTGAARSVWIDDDLAVAWNLMPLRFDDVQNQYGPGTVLVGSYEAELCRAGDCFEWLIYSVDMGHDCIWGLI